MPISWLSFEVIHAKKRSQWITLFEIASQWSTSQAYWMTLALISNIANYLKYNYFWDCDGIDNVTLRLWKFSDFCSGHIAGVAGDDIMFHILVSWLWSVAIHRYAKWSWLMPWYKAHAAKRLQFKSSKVAVCITNNSDPAMKKWALSGTIFFTITSVD